MESVLNKYRISIRYQAIHGALRTIAYWTLKKKQSVQPHSLWMNKLLMLMVCLSQGSFSKHTIVWGQGYWSMEWPNAHHSCGNMPVADVASQGQKYSQPALLSSRNHFLYTITFSLVLSLRLSQTNPLCINHSAFLSTRSISLSLSHSGMPMFHQVRHSAERSCHLLDRFSL